MANSGSVRNPAAGDAGPAEREWPVDAELLARLAIPGCPLCAQLRADEPRYYFWLLHESYSDPGVLAAFAAALGMCQRHGVALAQDASVPTSIGYLVSYVTRHALRLIVDERGRGTPLPPAERCPTCVSQDKSAGHLAYFLASLLRRADALDRYGQPALLCMPHFERTAGMLRGEDIERFLRLQKDAAQRALGKFGDPFHPGDHGQGDVRQAAELAVGIPPGAIPVQAWGAADDPGRPRDHLCGFARRLRDRSSCPVCAETMRAWSDWTAALERLVATREPVNDLLPYCRLHVWAYLLHATPVLGAHAARAALDSAHKALHMALEAGWGEKTKQEAMRLPAWRRAFGDEKPAARAMQALRDFAPQCPVCNRVALAEDRALDLLCSLLLAERHIRAYERGHGLCARHLDKVLRRPLDAEVRSVLLRSGAATIGCLLWELQEASRKQAWSARAEVHGTEQDAWRRALLRFSGAYGWRATGPER